MSSNPSSSSADLSPSRVLIAGAGLVGSLCASMLAQRGYHVLLIESREDPRRTRPGLSGERARSINLALSPRGIVALRSVDPELAQRVVKEGIAMRGRMVHKNEKKGIEKHGQDYGIVEQGEVIRSISRTLLGVYVLDHVESLKGKPGVRGSVEIRFETKVLELDLRSQNGVEVMLGSREKGEEKLTVDWVVGGDGAYSRVRRELMRGAKTRFNYRQSYAPHAYLELSIPPGPNDQWSIEKEYLHIWPRGEFMLIALPNQDKSFTLTLFAHQSTFDSLDEKLKSGKTDRENPVVELFRKEFPNALELMGEDALLKSWNENPKDGLITVECSPYHYKDKALLIGDAAHAMVPFYGQGMNCAFEDVRFLSTLLDHYSAAPLPSSNPSPLPYSSSHPAIPSSDPTKTPLENALAAYTLLRSPSLSAIQTLAAQNYAEMASSVLSPLYLLRLSLDRLLSSALRSIPGRQGAGEGEGGVWESLYRMTTFRWGLSYEEVIKRRKWQQNVLEWTAGVIVVAVAGVGLEVARRWGTLGKIRWGK